MSKIQEALRRIQSVQSDSPPGPSQVDSKANGEDEIVGTLTRQILNLDDFEEGVDPSDDRLVIVDRDRLIKSGLLAPEREERYMADQYRIIKRPILKNMAGMSEDAALHDMNLVMVASALPGDGKTFNCINLALSIATEKDTSVLLVDADVAKPHISKLFGITEEKGLIDLLTDATLKASDAIIKTDVPGLSVLPAGRRDSHATELLASRRMARLVEELSKLRETRVVIFDSPPILATSEAPALAASMGQIAMVVRAGHTPQQAVLEALDSLDESKAINLILNQAAAGIGSSGYGKYGYGYGDHVAKNDELENEGGK